MAILALAYPAIRTSLRRNRQPLMLFICGGNTCRSAKAETIAGTALATTRWRITSAGINATSGTPMPEHARTALTQIGLSAPDHRSRQVTPELIAEAHTIYTMTAAHRDAVLAIAPEAADKTICLDPSGDIPDPHDQTPTAYHDCATRIHTVIHQHLVPTGGTTSIDTRQQAPLEESGTH
jgi:protein-tyrosine-phosphatase